MSTIGNHLLPFFTILRMRINSVTSTARPNSVVTMILNDFMINAWKFLQFDNISDNFSHILLRMRRNSYFSACGYNNYDITVGFSDPDFP